jgi:hypothetical protein
MPKWSYSFILVPNCMFFVVDIFLDFIFLAVRGMMYYRRALMLQSYLEKRYLGGVCGVRFVVNQLNTFPG